MDHNKNKYVREFESYLNNATGYQKKNCIDKLIDKICETKTNLCCLKTKPDILYKKPVCGNNITEPGEECDCMWVHQDQTDQNLDCDNPCCNAATCRVKKTNYSCAFGECCDLNSCTIKLKNYEICRPASHQCDAEEYCDGEAAFCPKDKFVNDSRECSAVTECRHSFIDDEVVFYHGTTNYKGVCNSKGFCQDKKKISSPIYKTKSTDSSTTVYSDSQWKTYLFIQSAVILLGGIIPLSVYVYNTYMKKYRFRFCNQDQQRQTNNSSLRNRTINEPTPVNEDNHRLTETALDSFEMNSLSHREHEYDELNAQSNIYENPSEIHQKCENNSSDNYGYTTAHSCPSTTGSDDQQNIDNICTITIPKQQAPGYEYENCDKSNNILDPIHDSASSADENHHHITFLRPLSTTSSGYQIPITSNSNDRYHQHIGTW